MKLGSWNDPGDFNLNASSGMLSSANIIEANRFIYLFFDDNVIYNYKNGISNPPGTPLYGKAIQVNLSLSKGGQQNIELPPFLRGSDNSTYMVISMYVYDTIFDTNITNIHSAEFTLINSMVSSTTNEYTLNKAFCNGFNFYDKDIRDKPEIKDLIERSIYVQAPSIPEPMFYTMYQQEVELDELYSLTSMDTVIVHRGVDLIDDNTRISVMNSKMLDTLEPMIRSKLAEVKAMSRNPSVTGVNMYDQLILSESLLYQDFESMQSGYTYIYDSNMGFNILKNSGSFMPFKKYQFEDSLVGNLERTMNRIKEHAKDVEKKFGSVRMVFTPMYFGDKTDVYFKDYNPDNQPIIKDKLNIDNGNKIKSEMSCLINDGREMLNNQNEYYNDEELGGYEDGLSY